jgi:hypothetical protein
MEVLPIYKFFCHKVEVLPRGRGLAKKNVFQEVKV